MISSIKCDTCGKFIPYKDLESGRAKSHFTPDSEYTAEDTWFECGKCALREFGNEN